MASNAEKRSHSAADLPHNNDSNRRCLQHYQDQLFVYTNNDACIVLQCEKLLRLASTSWFAKLVRDTERGDAGNTQENPIRVSLPTWFVQDVADWTQPLSTTRIHSSRSDTAVREMLAAIGWVDTETDLPMSFSNATSPGHTVGDSLVDTISARLATHTRDSLGKKLHRGSVRQDWFVCTAFGPDAKHLYHGEYASSSVHFVTEKEFVDMCAAMACTPRDGRRNQRLCYTYERGIVSITARIKECFDGNTPASAIEVITYGQ